MLSFLETQPPNVKLHLPPDGGAKRRWQAVRCKDGLGYLGYATTTSQGFNTINEEISAKSLTLRVTKGS